MTALSSSIKFNSSTGDDAQASGCGPAVAITITLQTSAGSSTANASGNLAGLNSGDLMYVPSFTGRKFNVIASVQPLGGTITFDDNWDDSSAGVSGYVGGKRATFDNADSRLLFSDDLFTMQGVIIETETDQTISSYLFIKPASFGDSATPMIFRGSSGGIKTITQTAADYHFRPDSTGSAYWSNLKFDNSNATTNSSCQVFWNRLLSQHWHFSDCVFGDTTNTIYSVQYDNSGSWAGTFHRCKFQSTTDYAFKRFGHLSVKFVDCLFDSCYGGVNQASSAYGYTGGSFNRCVFSNITNQAIVNNAVYNQYLGLTDIDTCIFYNCGTGLEVAAHVKLPMACNSIFANCTTGLDLNGAGQTEGGLVAPFIQGNAFFNCTTDIDSLPNHLNVNFEKITLAADPFVDSANGDFNIADNTDGNTLRANNFSMNTDTAVYPFRPYVSDNFGSGGGSPIIIIED